MNVIFLSIFIQAVPSTALYSKSLIWLSSRIVSSTIQGSNFHYILPITWLLQIFYHSRIISLFLLLYTFLDRVLKFNIILIIQTFHIRVVRTDCITLSSKRIFRCFWNNSWHPGTVVFYFSSKEANFTWKPSASSDCASPYS